MDREVEVQSRVPSLGVLAEQIVDLFKALDQFSIKIPPGDLSIVFLEEDALTQMHADFLNDPTSTDVITFPGDPDMNFAGEIFVSPEKAYFLSKEQCVDFSEELTLYLVHGWLHLAGYNDLSEADQVVMRSAEEKTLIFLHEKNKIPAFCWNG